MALRSFKIGAVAVLAGLIPSVIAVPISGSYDPACKQTSVAIL